MTRAAFALVLSLSLLSSVLTACGGGDGAGSNAAATTDQGADGDSAPGKSPQPTAPTIATAPAPQVTQDGASANFAVTVGGTGPFTFQWLRNGAAIEGANTATLAIAAAQLSDHGSAYAVVVTNAGGSAQSSAATLTVNPIAPSIADNTAKTVNVAQGDPISLSVTASGSQPLNYQWQKNGINIAGATAASYTTAIASPGDQGAVFTVQVSNVAGTLTSAAFTANVTLTPVAPSFVTNPVAVTVGIGGTANFSASTTGNTPISYQWLRDGAVIAGATNASYSLTGATLADNGALFSVRATNTVGNTTSSSALLTVSQASVTVAGLAGSSGTADGNGSAARFASPLGIAIDSAGNYFIADRSNHTIRKVTPAGEVTTFAGTAGVLGSVNGTGTAARFNQPTSIAIDSSDTVYVADLANHVIRKITPAGVVTTLAGTANAVGSADGSGAAARFNSPMGVAVDSAGVVFVADTGNNTIRRITAAGEVTTFAGTAGLYGGFNGTGTGSNFSAPQALAIDAAGNIYVADTDGHAIRKITSAGVASTLAGISGQDGSSDGTGAAALFNFPWGIAVTASGTVYVTDTFNRTIRKISAAGEVTTILGSVGVQGTTDAVGTAALFNYPVGIAIDSAGGLVITDQGNNNLRRVPPGY